METVYYLTYSRSFDRFTRNQHVLPQPQTRNHYKSNRTELVGVIRNHKLHHAIELYII